MKKRELSSHLEVVRVEAERLVNGFTNIRFSSQCPIHRAIAPFIPLMP